MSLRLHLVRHAESEWQAGSSADLDSALTERGREQADRLAAWAGARPEFDARHAFAPDRIFTSPLARARRTAEPVSRSLGAAEVVSDVLSEAPFRVADLLPRSEDPRSPPARTSRSAVYRRFKAQAVAALRLLIDDAQDAGRPACAVTHGGLIKTLVRSATGADSFCLRLYNTGITTLDWRDGRWHLVHLNYCEHLPPGLRTV